MRVNSTYQAIETDIRFVLRKFFIEVVSEFKVEISLEILTDNNEFYIITASKNSITANVTLTNKILECYISRCCNSYIYLNKN